jgi:hypothetical protein
MDTGEGHSTIFQCIEFIGYILIGLPSISSGFTMDGRVGYRGYTQKHPDQGTNPKRQQSQDNKRTYNPGAD